MVKQNHDQGKFPEWKYKVENNPRKDLIYVVVITVIGTFMLISIEAFDKFHQMTRKWEDTIDLDELLMGFIVLSFCLSWFSMRRWRYAKREVRRRRRAEIRLEQAYKGELVSAAHKAGMAEVAVGVLHNVGNILNSIGVATHTIDQLIGNSRLSYLQQSVELINDNRHDPAAFFSTDEKGKQLPEFLNQLLENLQTEQQLLKKTIEKLNQNVAHINEIINLQYAYSKLGGTIQKVLLHEVVEDAIMINSEALVRHEITLKRRYESLPPIYIDRSSLLQILTNLIGNAKYALSKVDHGEKKITLSIKKSGDRVTIEVKDNGVGITAANMKKIFNFGFTTRKKGHGYGLHSGSLAAAKMEGTLTAHSDGPGKGAVFTLNVPFKKTISNQDLIDRSMGEDD